MSIVLSRFLYLCYVTPISSSPPTSSLPILNLTTPQGLAFLKAAIPYLPAWRGLSLCSPLLLYHLLLPEVHIRCIYVCVYLICKAVNLEAAKVFMEYLSHTHMPHTPTLSPHPTHINTYMHHSHPDCACTYHIHATYHTYSTHIHVTHSAHPHHTLNTSQISTAPAPKHR